MKQIIKLLILQIIYISNSSFAIASVAMLQDVPQIIRYVNNNSDFIANLEKQYEIEQLDLAADQKIYDHDLTLSYDNLDAKYPSVVSFEASDIVSDSYDIMLEHKLPLGVDASYGFGFENVYTVRNGKHDYDRTAAQFNITIDLLRNILGRMDKSLLKELEIKKQISKFAIDDQKDEFLFELSHNILLTLQQQDFIKLQQIRCDNLFDLYQINQKKYKRKTIELQNYLLIKLRYESCIKQLDKLQIDKDILFNKIYNSVSTVNNNAAELLAKDLSWGEEVVMISRNISNNPKLKIAEFAIKTSKETYERNKLNKLPDLKFGSAIIGRSQDLANSDVDDIRDYDYPSYNINLQMKVALGKNRKEKLLYEKSVLEFTLQQRKYRELEKFLKLDYDNTINEIKKYQSLLKQQKSEIKTREVIFKERRKDFLVGRITTQEIIDTQDELTLSQRELSEIKFAIYFYKLKSLLLTGAIQEYYS